MVSKGRQFPYSFLFLCAGRNKVYLKSVYESYHTEKTTVQAELIKPVKNGLRCYRTRDLSESYMKSFLVFSYVGRIMNFGYFAGLLYFIVDRFLRILYVVVGVFTIFSSVAGFLKFVWSVRVRFDFVFRSSF